MINVPQYRRFGFAVCLLAVLLPLSGGAYGQPLKEFKTVAQVERDLRASDEVRFYKDKGWLIAESGSQIWSFTSEGHPAHPAVVERSVYEEDGTVGIRTRQLCTAPESACSALRAGFSGLNEKISQAVSGEATSSDPILRLPGIEFRYERGVGWQVSRHQAALLVMKKQGPEKNGSTVASVQLYRAPTFETLEDYLADEREQRIKSHNSDPRVQDPVASETLVRHDGADCIWYQYAYRDTGAKLSNGAVTTAKYSSRGLKCIHPFDSAIGVDLGYSVRYFDNLDEAELTEAAQAQFNAIRFVDFEWAKEAPNK